jgi:hypothetical protein
MHDGKLQSLIVASTASEREIESNMSDLWVLAASMHKGPKWESHVQIKNRTPMQPADARWTSMVTQTRSQWLDRFCLDSVWNALKRREVFKTQIHPKTLSDKTTHSTKQF